MYWYCAQLHPPAYVDPESRYKRIFAQIEAEVKRGSIICLQEVNRDWAGRLHAYFANNEYHFAYSEYLQRDIYSPQDARRANLAHLLLLA
jgi:hypothetical protein